MGRTIEIDTTGRGAPAMWERGGGYTSGGSAIIIATPSGRKPRATFVPTGGNLACGQHALIVVHDGFYAVHASVRHGQPHTGSIELITKTSVKNVYGEKFEATAVVEVISTFANGRWDPEPDYWLRDGIEAAFKKAGTYHCRQAMYVKQTPRAPLSVTARNEMARQDRRRARMRADHAAEVARERAEAADASREAKLSGLGVRLEAVQVRLAALRDLEPSYTYGELRLGEDRFTLGLTLRDVLYTEENVAQAERTITYWEQQAAVRTQRTAVITRFKAHSERIQALGLSLVYGQERTHWADANPFAGFTYDNAGLAAFEEDLAGRELAAAAQVRHEQFRAVAAALGLPDNIRIWKRTGGMTNCGMGWVITPNGHDRERDELDNPNPRRAFRYDEGHLVWRQILPGEFVLLWSKANRAAPHRFEVVHTPREGLTQEQRDRVAQIEQELEERWPDTPIGDGWGLGGNPSEQDEPAPDVAPADPVDVDTALRSLRGKFCAS